MDTDKGDFERPHYRSRIVGKEFNNGAEDGLFASTPPLESLRLLLSEAATLDSCGRQRDLVMLIADVSHAFFEADAKRKIAVKLPREALTEEEVEQDLVGVLRKSLYGTRDAAINFQREVRRLMVGLDFCASRYNPSLFVNKKTGVLIMVHGDDFVGVGTRHQMEHFRADLESLHDQGEDHWA